MTYKREVTLSCAHCAAEFTGTYKQFRNMETVGSRPYCSSACRSAGIAKRLSRPPHNCGPCPTCKKTFTSRYTGKKFCGMKCYLASDQMKQQLQSNIAKIAADTDGIAVRAEKARKGQDVDCLECGTSFYQKRATAKGNKKKFCRITCYRAYLAKRFDRWIANPEEMMLPQCYDEFLEKENLPCLIKGCDWRGRHLSVHANQAHGVKADELKRAAGFNLGSGLVCKSLAELLQDRPKQGVALDNPWVDKLKEAQDAYKAAPIVTKYKSQEAREHYVKARIFSSTGPIRFCQGCGKNFVQSTQFGRAKFCSVECRSRSYQAKNGNLGPQPKRERLPNGVFCGKGQSV